MHLRSVGDGHIFPARTLPAASSSGIVARNSLDNELYEDALDGSGWRRVRLNPYTGNVTPAALGMVCWTTDGDNLTSGFAPASGNIQLCVMFAGKSVANGSTITLAHSVSTKGTTLTSGQNLIGLYRLSGGTLTLIASVDMTTAWAATVVTALTPTATLTGAISQGDTLFSAFLSVGTTPPTFRAAPSSNFANLGPQPRRMAYNTQTSLPSTIPYSSLTNSTLGFGLFVY